MSSCVILVYCVANTCVLIAVCCVCVLPSDGTISSSSILLAQSLLHNLQGQSCSPSELFYQGNAQPIQEWLTVAITRALHQGEESLLELTKQVCCFLQVPLCHILTFKWVSLPALSLTSPLPTFAFGRTRLISSRPKSFLSQSQRLAWTSAFQAPPL